MIMKSNNEMKEIVKNEIFKLIEKWFDHADQVGIQLKDIPLPEVKFDVKSHRTNGLCEYMFDFSGVTLNFNFDKLSVNFDSFLAHTVIHEVAHYCVLTWRGVIRSRNGRRIVHGADWKWMMGFFGCDAKRCFSHENTSIINKKRTTFTYQCSCRNHELTIIRHNRVRRGTQDYICNKCKTNLIYVG